MGAQQGDNGLGGVDVAGVEGLIWTACGACEVAQDDKAVIEDVDRVGVCHC